MLGVVASLFGLLLAFVIVIEFQASAAASDNVQTEADVSRPSSGTATGSTRPAGANVRSAIGNYVRAVTDKEWPLMRHGDEALSLAGHRPSVRRHAELHPRLEVAGFVLRRRGADPNSVLEARSNRLSASDGNDLPPLVAALVIVGAVVILGTQPLSAHEAPRSMRSVRAPSPSSSASRSSSSLSSNSRSRATSPSAHSHSKREPWLSSRNSLACRHQGPTVLTVARGWSHPVLSKLSPRPNTVLPVARIVARTGRKTAWARH